MSQAIQLDFKDDASLNVHVCPVCGSTELRVQVIRSATQEPDGSWKMDEVQDEDLAYEATRNNIEVHCANPTCGNPTLADGTEIDISKTTILDYWKTMKGLPLSHQLTVEEQEEFRQFYEGEIFYHPWSGVIADCPVL